MQAQEMVILVDEQDNQIGIDEKLAVHRAGKLHRAFSVFIFRRHENDKIEVLLQQREANKYHCGGLWTNTCCSHPRRQELVHAAASRRLREEIGINAELHAAGSFCYRAEFDNGLIEHELDHVFIGMYADDEIKFDPAEVQATKWIELQQLKQDLLTNAASYTPWLKPALIIAEQELQSDRWA